MAAIPEADLKLRKQVEGRLIGLRVNRYSWWTHARELGDYYLPRRYKWLITPNQMARGSPINQHILDSTGTLAARNLASGLVSGVSSPTRPWIKLGIGKLDSTMTGPIPVWLRRCEILLHRIFQESNFYNSIATVYFDLVIFGTAVMLIYEDFDNVICCYNPCFGEYYLDNDGQLRPNVFYREFTYTVSQVVDRWGLKNCSPAVQRLYKEGGAGLTRELVVAHAIEPNVGDTFGIPKKFKFREVYWEWGGSASPQGGAAYAQGFLEKKGYHENPAIAVRWDLVANDAYGRSPGMDGLPDVKQLQQEVRRKAQAIDKSVNPPMVADIQLKNQPASLLPGGMTYLAGMMQTGNEGFKSVYGNWRPDIAAMSEDLQEIRERIKKIFFNDILQTASQFETRSNVTAVEWDMRKSESLVMLGPVLERIYFELLKRSVDRTFNIAARAGILPQPIPQEIAGAEINVEFISMLYLAQQAAASAGIERTLQLAGNLVGVDPQVMDNIDIDVTMSLYSNMMNNDPRMIRDPRMVAQIRQQRQQQQQQQEQAQAADAAQKYAASAKNLSETQVGGGQNALQAMTGVR